MTSLARVVLVAALLAGVGASAAPSGARPQFIDKRVVFIAITGHGRVTSSPRGIHCPGTCRARTFVKDQTVRLVAAPAAGWRLARWSGSCNGRKAACVFALTDSHDCAGGMCPVGAFGERVTFVRRSSSA